MDSLNFNPMRLKLPLSAISVAAVASDFPERFVRKKFPGLPADIVPTKPAPTLAFIQPASALEVQTELERGVFDALREIDEIAWYIFDDDQTIGYTNSQLRYTIKKSYGDSQGEQEYYDITRYNYNSALAYETKISSQVVDMFEGFGHAHEYFSLAEATAAARADLKNFRNYHELTWWENPRGRYAYTWERPTSQGPLSYYIKNIKKDEPVRVERICGENINILGDYARPAAAFARAEKDFMSNYLKSITGTQ